MISASALVVLVALMAQCHSAPRPRREEFWTDFNKTETKLQQIIDSKTEIFKYQTMNMADCKNDYEYIKYALETLSIPCESNTNQESCSLLYRLRNLVKEEQILCRTPVAPVKFLEYIKRRYQQHQTVKTLSS